MMWVVVAHCYAFVGGSNSSWLISKYSGFTNSYASEIIFNGYFSVDTFFFMSGLLVAYLCFLELDKKRFNLPMFYILRYIRLTIPLMFVMAFNATIFEHLPSGPNSITDSGHACREFWWKNVLYMQTIIRPLEGICEGHTWYLATDMMGRSVL
jgi:peptidoglycan/LPS O-acetylase OafA/YrhL